ncbi:hypothetical protein K470DRAFT_88279 [Piedraia hortae CBS 480.64]|uniref:Uncharacterized protein n=1 Tax=Piedraia hortae CBS 480.64 TaxID=1314780 RepID=A0A6A7BYY4_9PEZI|nr:hypothetical protein K470DRAFT_88279 [Piedraia hortae CBS 480.64]
MAFTRTLFITALFAFSTSALPRVSYSVVDVDGSGASTSTSAVSPVSNLPTTVYKTITSDASQTVSVTVEPSFKSASVATSVEPTTITVTTTPTPSATSYYDNGQWHTSYPIKPSTIENYKRMVPTGTGIFYKREVGTGTAVFKREVGTGTAVFKRSAPTGTAVYYNKRADSTGNILMVPSGFITARAAPTAINVVSWNETRFE